MHARSLTWLLLGCASTTVQPALITTPPDHQDVPMNDARRELHALPDPLPEGDLEAWWRLASLALEAYQQPCSFPAKRDAIQASLEAARAASARAERAHVRRSELADLEGDETPEEIEAIYRARIDNADEREDATMYFELRMSELVVSWGEWSYACVGIVTDEFERNGDDIRVFMGLEDELARLSR